MTLKDLLRTYIGIANNFQIINERQGGKEHRFKYDVPEEYYSYHVTGFSVPNEYTLRIWLI